MSTGSTDAADGESTTARVHAIDDVRYRQLAARLEPFDSYWQAPADVEKGYSSFSRYYEANYLPHMPADRASAILVVSCGPGYLVDTLRRHGYRNVAGIDSDPSKVAHAVERGLPCSAEKAFPYLAERRDAFDVIIPEQELNHLTLDEQIEFLRLCRRSLRPNGVLLAYGLNGANPLVATENLTHNIDHFNVFTEYSLRQILELGGFDRVRVLPLKIYVFWKNPLNYVGLAMTGAAEIVFRCFYKLYGKDVKILSKKIAAVCRKPATA